MLKKVGGEEGNAKIIIAMRAFRKACEYLNEIEQRLCTNGTEITGVEGWMNHFEKLAEEDLKKNKDDLIDGERSDV